MEVTQKATWGCWTDYSACSVTCGIGRKVRYRKCVSSNGDLVSDRECDGPSSQDEICEMPSCDCKLKKMEMNTFDNNKLLFSATGLVRVVGLERVQRRQRANSIPTMHDAQSGTEGMSR